METRPEWWDELSPEEQAAWEYATAADGNPIDEFTPMNKLMMKAAFLAGIYWERERTICDAKPVKDS